MGIILKEIFNIVLSFNTNHEGYAIVITVHAQHERVKVIGVGPYMLCSICVCGLK